MEKRKAPWKDFKGNDIYEGDLIKHPNGMVGGYVFFIPYFNSPHDQWRVAYDELGCNRGDIGRLSLQIGDKGQAVVVGKELN